MQADNSYNEGLSFSENKNRTIGKEDVLRLQKTLSEEQKQKAEQIMKDPDALKKLLSSPAAKELLAKFGKTVE